MKAAFFAYRARERGEQHVEGFSAEEVLLSNLSPIEITADSMISPTARVVHEESESWIARVVGHEFQERIPRSIIRFAIVDSIQGYSQGPSSALYSSIDAE